MNQESPPYHDSNLSPYSFTLGKLYQWSFEHNPITQDKKITADFFIFFYFGCGTGLLIKKKERSIYQIEKREIS